jgi:hypothetical protein
MNFKGNSYSLGRDPVIFAIAAENGIRVLQKKDSRIYMRVFSPENESLEEVSKNYSFASVCFPTASGIYEPSEGKMSFRSTQS